MHHPKVVYTALRDDAVELQPITRDDDDHTNNSASQQRTLEASPGPHQILDDQTRTTAVIALSSVMEKLDEQLLPSVYPYVARSLQASPAALGYLTLSRALVQSVASPLGGLLGATIQ